MARVKKFVSPVVAKDFLSTSVNIMDARGKEYDSPEGERSMAKTVTAFNIITGHELKESDGWMFMEILKNVRQNQNRDSYHEDSAIDGVTYSALKAEALARGD